MYAIFEDRGSQHRVSEGERIIIARKPVKAGEVIEFDRVLLVSKPDGIRVGFPYVANAKVRAIVEKEVAGEKIRVIHFRRRKNYRKETGHRQKYISVKIQEIIA